jgi:hypothetical protein
MNYFAELEGNVEFLAEINQTGQIYKVNNQRVMISILLLSLGILKIIIRTNVNKK